ncbi:MAG: ribose-5-phosphate isomerase RpiA [Gammaproteobacteria bacterium]|nr:ribose-5-phosphate isomerase RpiA [Gammaproteobacteria bacterium]
MVTPEIMKENSARKAIEWVEERMWLGIGTGSTVNYFIDYLANIQHKIEGTVASSKATAERLKKHHIPVYDLNAVDRVDLYVDGADEVNAHLQLIKGGGGALTGEKIIASVSRHFLCIVDETKKVECLGAKHPVPVEVIPMARSVVARALVKLGGQPVYRPHFVTDYGNIILDVYGCDLSDPLQTEQTINQIPGVVTNGIFACRRADTLIVGEPANRIKD